MSDIVSKKISIPEKEPNADPGTGAALTELELNKTVVFEHPSAHICEIPGAMIPEAYKKFGRLTL